ncbi:MAG: MAPEG family protein [Gammaproteobacteria bacterium]|nr:MAPEG family protein [Gammaproteobacteria bacterium]
MNTAIFCTGALGILLFGLSFAVSMVRLNTKVGIGTDGSSTSIVTRSVRAQGNAAEYIAAFMVLFLFLGSREPAAWIEWTMIIATAARYVHAAGMYLSLDLNQEQPLRFAGSALTYATGLVLSGAAIAAALS